MSDDIRVGDRFLVEVEVRTVAKNGDIHVIMPIDELASWAIPVPTDVLRAAKRLPRQIKVGDKVRTTNDGWRGVAEVIALQGEFAWLRDSDLPAGEPWTRAIEDITLADEPSS